MADAVLRQAARAYAQTGLLTALDAWDQAERRAGNSGAPPALRLRHELEVRLALVLMVRVVNQLLIAEPHAPKPMLRAQMMMHTTEGLSRLLKRAEALGIPLNLRMSVGADGSPQIERTPS